MPNAGCRQGSSRPQPFPFCPSPSSWRVVMARVSGPPIAARTGTGGPDTSNHDVKIRCPDSRIVGRALVQAPQRRERVGFGFVFRGRHFDAGHTGIGVQRKTELFCRGFAEVDLIALKGDFVVRFRVDIV
jgi:hypothetical protein